MSPRKAGAVGGDVTLPEHLVAAAGRLIARQGAAGLTVRAVAREAGVADGVLYNHFADKDELLAQALHAHVRTVARALPPLPEPGTADLEANLLAYVTYGVEFHRAILPAFAGLPAQPGILTRFAALGGGPDLKETLAGYLREELALGRLSPSADPDAAATMIVGACHELVLPHLFAGAPAAAVDVPPGFAARIVATCLHGIGPHGP
ncbi:TetR/AcrR family transcriptional regulator [Nonomuraea sp. NPDC049725]|uniref:TetR/AcrR family transcriptional regulator n=1 Tax=Nonomuraea sp. NPDC049725 TaxID=3154508 RepID=UPI00341EE22B